MLLTACEQNWIAKCPPVGTKLYHCKNGPLYLRRNSAGIEMIVHAVEAVLSAKAQLLLWVLSVWARHCMQAFSTWNSFKRTFAL